MVGMGDAGALVFLCTCLTPLAETGPHNHNHRQEKCRETVKNDRALGGSCRYNMAGGIP